MKSYETKNNGSCQLYKCEQCNKVFSETINTFLEGIIKPISLIIQVLTKGLKVIIKNKGSQNGKRGRKRKKYEIPHREHSDTVQNVTDNDIHANHVEAFNASCRRKHSALRRKTNTYAKKKSALQRVLDGYWIIHTVFLGIIEV